MRGRRREGKEKMERSRDEVGPRRHSNFTPLTVSLATLLKNEKGNSSFQRPTKTKGTPQKSKSKKYCRFHLDKGHDTEDCSHLREEVERLVLRGQLKEYIKRDSGIKQVTRPEYPYPRCRSRSNEKRRSPPRRRTSNFQARDRRGSDGRRPSREDTPPKRVIHTISGGPHGGDSSNARKKNSWSFIAARAGQTSSAVFQVETSKEMITFGSKDLEGLVLPHCDPLVVAVDITGCIVKRVLVDSGSSADIMSLETFEQLGLDRKKLKSVSTPLMGFGGSMVDPCGVVDLPTTLGRGKTKRTEWISFLVVDVPGRTTLFG